MLPLFVLVLVGVDAKKAVPLSMLGVLPDADVLFHIHRSMSHSAVFLLAICIPALLMAHLIGKRREYHDDNRNIRSFEPCFYGHVHGIHTDFVAFIFTGFTPILWPLYKSVWISAEMLANMSNVLDIHLICVKISPVVFHPTADVDAPIFTSQGVSAVMGMIFADWRKRDKEEECGVMRPK